jgi:hypothetical protein
MISPTARDVSAEVRPPPDEGEGRLSHEKRTSAKTFGLTKTDCPKLALPFVVDIERHRITRICEKSYQLH